MYNGGYNEQKQTPSLLSRRLWSCGGTETSIKTHASEYTIDCELRWVSEGQKCGHVFNKGT